jgi:heme-degrading monooxygenase HmoA
MPALPWTTVAPAEPDAEVVVMASTFRLRSARHVPGFLSAAMRIRRQVAGAPGALGLSLDARPFRRTFFTLSAWRDRESIDAMIVQDPHRATMERYRPQTDVAEFRFWTTRGETLPVSWDEARRRLSEPAG